MLTRELAGQIQSDQQLSNDMGLSSMLQFEAMLRAAMLITRVQVNLASAGRSLWDNTGVGDLVLNTPDGQCVGDGKYDAAHIRDVQMMWQSYTMWLTTPITVEIEGQVIQLEKTPLKLILSAPAVGAAPEQPIE